MQGPSPTAEPQQRVHIARSALNFGRVSVALDRHGDAQVHCHRTHFGHNHPVFRLLMVLSGQMRMFVGSEPVTLGSHGGLLLSGETPYSYQVDGDVTLLRVDLGADDPAFRKIPLSPRRWPDESPVIAAATAFIVQALRSAEKLRPISSTERLTPLEKATISLVSSMIPSGRLMGGDDAVDLRGQISEYIAAHCSDPNLTPESIAQAMGRSVRTLQRMYQGDASLSAQIRAARLENAMRLLCDPRLTLTVSAVARRTGFGSAATLRRAIQLATGVSPSEHRVTATCGAPVTPDRLDVATSSGPPLRVARSLVTSPAAP